MYERIKRHWVCPHLVAFFIICLLIDLIALGFGIVWSVRYLAGLVGGWTLFGIVSVVALYLFIWGKVRSGQLSELREGYENSSAIVIPARNGTEPLRRRKDRIVTVRKTGTSATMRNECRAGFFRP